MLNVYNAHIFKDRSKFKNTGYVNHISFMLYFEIDMQYDLQTQQATRDHQILACNNFD